MAEASAVSSLAAPRARRPAEAAGSTAEARSAASKAASSEHRAAEPASPTVCGSIRCSTLQSRSISLSGLCIVGGGKRCRVDDCNKVVQYAGLCVSHGGFRRCILEGCTKKALSNSFCAAHGGSSRLRQVSREINERRNRSPSQWSDQERLLRAPVQRYVSPHKLPQLQTPPGVDRLEEAMPRFLSRDSLPSLLELESSRSEPHRHRLPTIAELQARRPLPPRDLFAPEKRLLMSFQRSKATEIQPEQETAVQWRWQPSSLEYMV